MQSKHKYLLAYSIPLVTFLSLLLHGWWSFATLIESFVIIPLFELILSPDSSLKDEEHPSKSWGFYDLLLYFMVPVQCVLLIFYLYTVTTLQLHTYEVIGMTLSMGIQSGAVGINVAHELGHRKSRFDRFLAKSLLLSSLYMHFIIEHNRGHHKNVATPQDPATARLDESVYFFWFRSIIGTFISAWKIEQGLQKKKHGSTFTFYNEMIQLISIESMLLLSVYLLFGLIGLIGFLTSSIIGIILLETVNYIEHYGLIRKQHQNGMYERVQPWHSWNSDFPIGRIILFELTRHSDHHYKGSKKYQTLQHLEESPQLPTGYPGMMLLSLIPPLWFKIVNPKLKRLNQSSQ